MAYQKTRRDHIYEAARNSLIPEAEDNALYRTSLHKYRTEKREGVDGEPFEWDWFTYYFHQEMNILSKANGLI